MSFVLLYPACMLSHFSPVQLFALFAAPQTIAHQAPLSMGLSRKEYWSGLPCPPPGESSQPRDQTHVSCCSCIVDGFFTASPLGKSYYNLLSPFPILPFILSLLPSLFPSWKDPSLKGWISICYSSGFGKNYPRSPGFSSSLSWCAKKIRKRILSEVNILNHAYLSSIL